MASINGSQEIYKFKQFWNSEDTMNMRAVRSVWVSGQYRPPYYIDIHLTINRIISTKASYVDYYERSVNVHHDNGSMNVIGCYMTQASIQRYTTQTQTIPHDNGSMNVIGCYMEPLSYQQYTQKENNVYHDNGSMNVIGCYMTSLTYQRYQNHNEPYPPDITIVINQMGSTKAKVTNE